MKHLLPQGWARPSGYSNGIQTDGTHVYVAGMIGWDSDGKIPPEFIEQFENVLKNTVAVLREAGAGPEHVVRMTWFIKGLDAYRENLPKIGKVWRKIIGDNFPAMAVVGVTDLVERDALVEIETTAVIPKRPHVIR